LVSLLARVLRSLSRRQPGQRRTVDRHQPSRLPLRAVAVIKRSLMRSHHAFAGTLACVALLCAARATGDPAKAARPNIVFIMGDDIGWFNIGVSPRGMMAGGPPNLDRLAAQGMMFTDYYAEASCTAGRANFITGQLPIRTGLTTVGQAGATVGMPAQAPTLA